jgi:hypothetical protein
MNSKRPYKHILKNLFHEQISEIIPLLLPEYEIVQAFQVELPELKIIDTVEVADIERPEDQFKKDIGQGVVGLVLPGAQVTGIIHTEWIEHSGQFERGYRARLAETEKPVYMVFEVQIEREDIKLPRKLLLNFIEVTFYAKEDILPVGEEEDEDFEDENEDEEDEEESGRGTIINDGFNIYPAVLCPFPSAVPAPIRDEINGEVTMAFNFKVIRLWEKDAREFLNTHVSAIYYLLPAMKNADAALLRLAIEELAQRFQGNDTELGRHLTGMSLMLQESEVMSDEEQLAAQEHLKRFSHLMKDDPFEE